MESEYAEKKNYPTNHRERKKGDAIFKTAEGGDGHGQRSEEYSWLRDKPGNYKEKGGVIES